MGSVSGGKAKPAIYSVTIERRRIAVPVHLNRQHGAFRETNPELGRRYSTTRARPSPQPSHDGHDDNDQDAGNLPTGRLLRCTIRAIPYSRHTLDAVSAHR